MTDRVLSAMSSVDGDKSRGVHSKRGIVDESAMTGGRCRHHFASRHISQLARRSPALIGSQVLPQHDVMKTTHGGHAAGHTGGQVPDLERAVQR